ncbi:hypothetical protein HER10_EVM0005226 [Colletotrichum scovillei]|uniref:uncharacterized protein n=1 Tax=Colletotrichum scovillei TaxID=1209932 RepID=UPI0015C3C2E6|nr:uncharacterized protein HER10_EVM0005226 [Colletotrichum scovillei]KAF4774974.1 hypothetical protein HER10_EVM0005226 [Colletotrichum scovillei]KAG7061916.1 C6 finger domain protein [Colletotrichum scovillei]
MKQTCPSIPMAGQGTKKITRSRGACLACRARKHKCSGERPKCAQCGINNVSCQWPEQRKRGPPKHYIVTMEKRLMETEQVLCALLAQVSGDQLERAFRDIPKAGLRSTGSASSAHGRTSIEVVKGEKFGPVYWGSHPIDSAEAVQSWWADRTSKEPSETSNRDSHASEVAVTNDTPTDNTPGDDESYGDDDIEESEVMTRAESMEEDGETLMIDPDMSVASGIRDAGGGAAGLLAEGVTVSRANLNTRTSEKRRQTRPQVSESYESAFLW